MIIDKQMHNPKIVGKGIDEKEIPYADKIKANE